MKSEAEINAITWFARSVVPTTTGKRLIDTSMLKMCNFVFNTEMLCHTFNGRDEMK